MVTFETDELDQNFTFCCLIKRFIKIALTQNECACSLILIIGLSHHPEAKLFPSHESSFQNWNFFSKVKRKILWCTRWKLSIMWIRHHLQPINFINYIKARKPQKITFGALFAFRTFLSFLNTYESKLIYTMHCILFSIHFWPVYNFTITSIVLHPTQYNKTYIFPNGSMVESTLLQPLNS